MSKWIPMLALALAFGVTACSTPATEPETVEEAPVAEVAEEAPVEEVAEDSAFACYWLDPAINEWVSMNDLTTQEACVEMDSCSGGGGRSGGGCYEWSDEPPTVEESAAGTSDVPVQLPSSSSVKIVAADGGTISIAGATLEISPDALSADTTISMDASSAPSSLTDVTGQLFTFGPTGTQFSPSATLSLPLSESVPEGKRAVLAYVDGNTLTDIAGSSQTGAVVTGLIEHFSQVIVHLIDDISCESGSFTPCGGDVIGTWTMKHLCLADSDDLRKQEEESKAEINRYCTAAEVENTVGMHGTITFSPDFSFSDSSGMTVTKEFTFPAVCFTDESLGDQKLSDVANCSDITKYKDFKTLTWSCSGSPATEGCVCRAVDTAFDSPEEPRLGTYRTEGSKLVTKLNDDPDGNTYEEESLDYCVKGDSLYLGEQGLFQIGTK